MRRNALPMERTNRSLLMTHEDPTRALVEEQWHGPPQGEANAHTHHPCQATMSSRAPSQPCLLATFLFRFQRGLLFCYRGNPIEGEHDAEPHPAAVHLFVGVRHP